MLRGFYIVHSIQTVSAHSTQQLVSAALCSAVQRKEW